MSASRASAASVALIGGALAAVSFGAAGGSELGRTTVVELALILLGAAALAAAILYAPGGRLRGGPSVVALGAFTVLSGISIAWSVAPELSFADTGRMLAYLAVYAGAVGAARLAPRSSPVLAQGLLLAAALVVGYALASRVWPESLAENELSNRISEPFGYWNAVGTVAAMAVPLSLWLGARRTVRPTTGALAYPVLGAAVLAILLTQSRGALAAAVIGTVAWFALVPLRLRSLPVLLVPIVGAAPVAAWALSKDAFAKSLQPLSAKESVAGEFGLLVALMLVVLLLAGLALNVALSRTAPPMHLRRRVGVAALVAACAIPLVLFTSVAFSDRGLGGTISDRVDELTNDNATAPAEGAGRLTATSNSRATFWREAGKVFEDRPWAGTGDDTFGVSRLRYRKSEQVSRHAHGWVPQTLADLGIVGLVVSVLLLLAWLVAAARTTGFYPRLRRGHPRPRRDWDAERVAVTALALTPVVFGLQSLIDWTWFIPGPAVLALVSAGFVAGRGPVPAVAGELPTAEVPAAAEAPGAPAVRGLPLPPRPRLAAAAGVLVAALLCAWAVWQPERSDRLTTSALDLVDSDRLPQASEKAAKAEDANPLSPRPLFAQATVATAANRKPQALAALQRAVLRFPGDPQTWQRLADFQLTVLDRPAVALSTLQGALYLDPKSKAAHATFFAARSRLRAQQAELSRRRAGARPPGP